MLGDVVEKSALDGEGATGKRYFRLAVLADLIDRIGEVAGDVGRIRRRADGHDRFGLGNLTGRGQYCGAAEAVTYQKCRGLVGFAQVVGGADQIGDVGRKG